MLLAAIVAFLDNFYYSMLCVLSGNLLIFGSIFICEAIANHRFPKANDDPGLLLILNDPSPFKWLKGTENDIYYMIYMYSIMAVVLSGLFICVSEGSDLWRQHIGSTDPRGVEAI